jgi:hypothetical protein
MRHKKIQKWLSDQCDGELSRKKKRILDAHLERCSSCRSYAEGLERIAEETSKIKLPEVSPSYWEDFSSRLKARVSSIPEEIRKGEGLFLRWKWAFATAASLFVLALGLFLYLAHNKKTAQDDYIFSFENSFSQIREEIGDDSELEDVFNSILLASIDENLESDRMNMYLDFYGNTFFWENFSQEEEISVPWAEIEKETRL